MTREQYLAAVETRLNDLPWSVRKNLANELRVHLEEIPAQDDLLATLGSPQSYAAELRAAAELTPRRGVVAFVRARGPRNVILVTSVFAVAVALVAALAWASSYVPRLTPGTYGLNPIGYSEGALGETQVQFRAGKPFQYGFSIRNSGRFAVRIVGIPIMQAGFVPFVVRVFTESHPVRSLRLDVPFHPFTLEAGSERMIILRGRFAHCGGLSANIRMIFSAMPVRIRFLAWTHGTEVPLQDPLVVTAPRNPCAAR